MGPALTGYEHREEGVVTISKLDEPNKVGRGEEGRMAEYDESEFSNFKIIEAIL